MLFRGLDFPTIAAIALAAGAANARTQAPAAPHPLDNVPEEMPYNVPYGAPISADRAQAAIHAAEATKRDWPLDIAVVDSGANLVAFLRMDGAQLASIPIAEHKARAAAKYRRPTKVFEEGLQKLDYKYVLTLDDAITSRGGIPLIEDGKLIGAVGCSGGTGMTQVTDWTGFRYTMWVPTSVAGQYAFAPQILTFDSTYFDDNYYVGGWASGATPVGGAEAGSGLWW
jgi:glc operon protein GlcG